MTITERQGLILDKLIRGYIDSAEPVSSEFLEKKYHFGISPATIRIEMQGLTNMGYICQPHTSAGRIPTDKGYRFFVDNLLKEKHSDFEEIFEIEEILRKESKDILKLANDLTKFLAEESSNFAILHFLERDFLFKEGWEEILKEPEFEEKSFVFDFIKFLESFEKNIANLKINPVRKGRFSNGVNSEIKIFIGRENPFSKEKNFSIISSKFHLPKNGEGIVSLLGPKRMAYDKNISLLNSLIKILSKY